MRSVRRAIRFKKDVKMLIKRGKDMSKLKDIIALLSAGERLPSEYLDHQLKGTLKDCRECHLEPDWLLIYQIAGHELCLMRTGKHTDLFE
ncbi:MAG: type II toxin-antitoxin system YafQ family toxin [Deltaproteobacteria bacterium]|nr:type II toxin-antitoxin system YafQ family toxin [Deltaproteobacteria bacterium]MBF0526249.1 type II toxin-antitoxin system YafQ family toxin [Deltaproteobacteria bacterium]